MYRQQVLRIDHLYATVRKISICINCSNNTIACQLHRPICDIDRYTLCLDSMLLKLGLSIQANSHDNLAGHEVIHLCIVKVNFLICCSAYTELWLTRLFLVMQICVLATSLSRGLLKQLAAILISFSNVRSSFFMERVVNMWNCLPSDTVDFSSLSAFKHSIERVDLSDFLNFTQLFSVLASQPMFYFSRAAVSAVFQLCRTCYVCSSCMSLDVFVFYQHINHIIYYIIPCFLTHPE